MTEKEKMKAGLWYDANNDQELIDQRLVCQDLCFELNQLKLVMNEDKIVCEKASKKKSKAKEEAEQVIQ